MIDRNPQGKHQSFLCQVFQASRYVITNINVMKYREAVFFSKNILTLKKFKLG